MFQSQKKWKPSRLHLLIWPEWQYEEGLGGEKIVNIKCLGVQNNENRVECLRWLFCYLNMKQIKNDKNKLHLRYCVMYNWQVYRGR